MFYALQTQRKAFNANFHTGKLVYDEDKEFNWIYDCGDVLLARQYLKTVDKIDLIFISHFDSDHIKGLPTLLANTKTKYARIIVPYLTNEDIALLCCSRLGLSTKSKSENRAFQSFLDKLLNISRDEYPRDEYEPDTIDLPERNDRYWENNIIAIASGKSYSLTLREKHADEIWTFKTHVFEDTKLKQKIRAVLRGSTLIDTLRKDFKTFGSNFRKKYAKEIGAIKTKLKKESRNVMTMSMLSLPVETPRFCCNTHRSSGWLHTGDAYLSDKNIWKQFFNFCMNYRCAIGYCVLPHHGSVHSENVELYQLLKENCNYIITPSSRVSFSYPPVQNLFCVVSANFQTIYTRCCHCERRPFVFGCTIILNGMEITGKCKSRCSSTCLQNGRKITNFR